MLFCLSHATYPNRRVAHLNALTHPLKPHGQRRGGITRFALEDAQGPRGCARTIEVVDGSARRLHHHTLGAASQCAALCLACDRCRAAHGEGRALDRRHILAAGIAKSGDLQCCARVCCGASRAHCLDRTHTRNARGRLTLAAATPCAEEN